MHVVVVGGGAAGMMAAGQAARQGARVTLLEKMETPGKKLLITGKGRCNITNTAEGELFLDQVNTNPRFLFSALHALDNHALVAYLGDLGLKTKVERGGRVFPVSDKAREVLQVFLGDLKEHQVSLETGTKVRGLVLKGGRAAGVMTGRGEIAADSVILATGGASYPATGSTGDGYQLARRAGHRIIPLRPGLVPLETVEKWPRQLQGLTLKNVELRVYKVSGEALLQRVLPGEKNSRDLEPVDSRFGEVLFTHSGISGPIVLTLSNPVMDILERGEEVILALNLKPALGREQLDRRLLRDFDQNLRRHFKNSLDELLPRKMIPVILELSGIPAGLPVNQVTSAQRQHLLGLLTGIPLRIKKARPLAEAIVTRGGVDVKEVNPKTMESRIVPGLFFAGEILDIDANTGGFNLQCAFSTGYVAGRCAARGDTVQV